MVHQPLKNKKGGTSKAVDYLLNEREQQGTARVLSGNPQLTKDLINSITNKHKASVGVLSFSEPNLPEQTKQQIMSDFEKTLLPGMEGRYNILWVEHTDKGRLELNYVIPKIDLETQRALNPYYDRADRARIETFRDIQNIQYNLSDPNDLSRKQTLNNDKRVEMFKDHKQLDKQLHDLVSTGTVESREQLVETLQNANIEVTRKGKDYISIKLPDDKRAKKYKGGIYSEQFTSIESIRETIKDTQREIRQYNNRDTQAELSRLREKLTSYNEHKARELQKVFSKPKQTTIKRDQKRSELEQKTNNNTNNIDKSINRDSSNDLSKTLSNTERESDRQRVDSSPRVETRSREREVYQDRERRPEPKEREQRNNEVPKDRGLEYDSTRERIERARRERESKYNTYRETRKSRTELHKSITETAKTIRAEHRTDSAELRESYREPTRDIQTRARATTAEHIKTVQKSGDHIESVKQIEPQISRYARFRERVTSYISTARSYLKDQYNKCVNAINECKYTLKGTNEHFERTYKKEELSFNDVKQTKSVLQQNQEYDQNQRSQERQRSHSYGLSR